MKKIIERLHDYIEFKGISLNFFDKSLGASNGYIGKQIKNKASIGGDIIEKISCIYTDLNIEWLITGQGQMLKDTEKAGRDELPGSCKLCEEKDKVIAAQAAQIATQSDYIELLKAQGPCESGQKRKAG